MAYTDLKKGYNFFFHANGHQKKGGISIVILDEIDYLKRLLKKKKKTKIDTITRGKDGHYIMIKDSMQEVTTILNMYAPNIRAP